MNRGNIRIRYLYDAEVIMGFSIRERTGGTGINSNDADYYFVKDMQGNVRSIIESAHPNSGTETNLRVREVARYEYDAWGGIRVVAIGSHTIGGISVAEFNCIRWKSQYFDRESSFYYIDGRYYSSWIRRFVSAENAESMLSSAGVIYGLNPYLISLDNTVNMEYSGHTIATNAPLSLDLNEPPPGIFVQAFRWWARFFGSHAGRITAPIMFVLALAVVVLSFGKAAAIIFAIGAGFGLLGLGCWWEQGRQDSGRRIMVMIIGKGLWGLCGRIGR